MHAILLDLLLLAFNSREKVNFQLAIHEGYFRSCLGEGVACLQPAAHHPPAHKALCASHQKQQP